MTANLLLELYSEEIPARMQKAAEEGFSKLLSEYCTKHKISFSKIEIFSCPTRITIHIEGLPHLIQSEIVEVKGPKASVPHEILERFCTSHNITQSELKLLDGCYTYSKFISEKKVSDILLAIIPNVLNEYTWPKSMHWGEYSISWVRPLRNILCLFNDNVLPVKYGHLTANNLTYGHKFMHFDAIQVANFDDYTQKLRASKVILSRSERRDIIQSGIKTICEKHNLKFEVDQGLLEEVVGLVEFPNVLCGEIPSYFLSLPREILIASMRTHQRYFATKDNNGGFANKFIFAANITTNDDSYIIEGNERVLNARLSDAKYFYEQDLSRTLESRIDDLYNVVFHKKIGTIRDKVIRLMKISHHLYGLEAFISDLETAAILSKVESKTEKWKSSEVWKEIRKVQSRILPERYFGTKADLQLSDLTIAATLSKADLTTEVVGEFPELQGVMGKYYAIFCDKVNDEIACAIEEHYMPRGANDETPSKPLGAQLSVIDKIDSLVCLFLAGEKPTGSKDPYALRRLAISIIRTILDHKLHINIVDLVKAVEQLYLGSDAGLRYLEDYDSASATQEDILTFIEERLKHFFKTTYEHNVVQAVVNLKSEHYIYAIKSKLECVDIFLKTERGSVVVNAYKRIKNIIPKNFVSSDINTSLLNDYEKKLYDAVSRFEISTDYEQTHIELYYLAMLTSDLFDNVLIDDNDSIKTQNRFSLLRKTLRTFDQYIDFSAL